MTAYCIEHRGAVTADLPLPHHIRLGRTVPVRLNTGHLRFYDPDDVERRDPVRFRDDR